MDVFGRALPRAARRIAAMVTLSMAGGLALTAAPAYADLGNQQIYIGGIVASCTNCTTSGSSMPYTRGGVTKNEYTGNAAVSTSSSGTTVDGANGAVFFCIDMNTPIGLGTPIENVTQAQAFAGVNNPSSVQNPNKLKWVMANGANYLNTTAFSQRLSDAGLTFNGGLTREEAMFGTQWAVWNFSEGDITPEYTNSTLTDTGKDVFKVAKWLIDNALSSFTEPTLSLTAPASTSGGAGDVLGPWTVNHNSLGDITLAASNGATLLSSASGGALSSPVAPGTQFWVQLPSSSASGTTTISASAPSVALRYVQAVTDPNTKQKGVYTRPVTLESASSASWTTAPVKVGDYVWIDANGDGIQQSGESGIPGVKLSIAKASGGAVTDLGGASVGQATTDGSGKYSFGNLPAGSYKVTVDSGVPAGLAATTAGAGSDTSVDSSTGSATSATLTAGQSDLTLDFGYYAPVRVGDRVWLDADGDGVQDSGEAGYVGATVTLTKPGGGTVTATTGTDGAYLFDNLPPGSYSVTVTVPGGYTATTATTQSSGTLASGGSKLTLDFGLKAIPPSPVVVGDFVWVDSNGNGVQDSGEPGISGVKLSIAKASGGAVTDLDGATVGQATTDANGKYEFGNLPAGSYVVTVASGVPAGHVATLAGAGSDTSQDSSTGSATSAALTAGQSDTSLDFGFYAPVKVGDRVWLDTDGDGVQDSGEPGISGVTVTLTKPGGGTATATSGTDGAYLFDNLAPGSYSVTVGSYAHHEATTATTQSSGILTSGQQNLTLDFGFEPKPVRVGDRVWLDSDGDGVQDSGEPGISGVTVTLTKPGGGTVSQTTGADGGYLFDNLPAGSYTVSVGSYAGHAATTATSQVSGALSPGGQNLNLDFGFKPKGVTVGDFVWVDSDRDGRQDAGEPGVAGVKVTLTTAAGGAVTDLSGATVGSKTTDSSGEYEFTNLPAGSYKVTVDTTGVAALSGFEPTTAGVGTSDQDSSTGSATTGALNAGESDLTLDFGFRAKPVTVGDFVWLDTDADGVQDVGEPGVQGAKLTLTTASGGAVTDLAGNPVGSTTTDSSGEYEFTNLPAGSYQVTIDTTGVAALAGKVPTTAGAGSDTSKDSSTGSATTGALGAGQSDLTLDFGFKDAPPLPVKVGDRVWLDSDGDAVQDAGEPGISGVTVTLTKPGGGTESQTTGANGAYLFDNLPAGSYTVTVTPPSGYDATTPTTQSSGALPGGGSNLALDFGFRTPPGSDLSIDKTADKAVAGPGDTITYTLEAHNDGSGDATDVVVTDTLPAGVTYQSSTAPCTFNGATVTCQLGTVAAGATKTVTITVTVNAIAGGDTSHQHQLDYTKVESHMSAFAGDTTVATQCPSGYVATDGSVRLDHVDQGAGSFADVDVRASGVTADGKGWTGTVRNNTTGQVQAKVMVVCASEKTTSGEDHSHPLVITGPVATTQSFGPGRHDVDLACASGSWAIAPSYVLTGDDAVVTTRRTTTGWRFVVDVPTSASGTFAVHCLSSQLGVAKGHSHDLTFSNLSDAVMVPAGGTVERKLTCADGDKGIVAWADLDPGLVSLGNDPQPITRVFKFYNPTGTALKADFGLLCVSIRTAGSAPGDLEVKNTARVSTSSPDASTADDTDSATTTVSPTGVTASPRAVVATHSGKTTVKVDLASSGKKSVVVRLVTAGKVAGLKAGFVLAQAKTSVKGRTTLRLLATKAATKALTSGKVGKAKLLITSGGKTSVKVVTLK